MINANQLKKITKEVKKEKEKQNEAKEREQKKRELNRLEEEKLLAKSIIKRATEAALKAAKRGETSSFVMNINSCHYQDSIYSVHQLVPSKLKGTALIVWNELNKAGFNCIIESWYDGIGMNSGYKILISWED